MNRPLAFRVFLDIPECNVMMVYPDTEETAKVVAYYVAKKIHGLPLPDTEGEVFIMQCLNLKSKESTWIYEGDILKEPSSSGILLEVFYNEESASFDLLPFYGPLVRDPEILSKPLDFVMGLEDMAQGLSVVGNIYEHPHLLINQQSPEDETIPGREESSS